MNGRQTPESDARDRVPLWLRWRTFKAWFHRCPECGHRPDRHHGSPGPRWEDDKIAAMLGIGQYGCRRCGQGATVERDLAANRLSCGALPPYSVSHIRPEVVGHGPEQWFVMGTVDGDPRDRCGPVAVCEYEPSARVIATLLNTSGGCVTPSGGDHPEDGPR